MNLKSINSRLRVPLGGAIALALFAALPARAQYDYPATVLAQNPAGYWRLNETAQPPPTLPALNQGSLGATANGAYNNFPTRGLPGPFAGSLALGLSGSGQSVTTPWQAGLNPNAFSVELWVNPAQVPHFAYVASSVQTTSPRSGWYLAQDDGSTFGLGSAYVLRMFYTNAANPSITLSAPVAVAGVWYHLVITYDGTTATMYMNGAVAQSGTPVLNGAGLGFVGNENNQTSFGCRSDNNFYWPGEQAEVAMYTGALTAARVSAHYAAGTTAPATYASTVQADSPVLWYRFLEAPEITAANASAAGSSLAGRYQYGTVPGGAGPRTPTYPGFDAGNDSVTVPGTGASVSVPALNFNTNTVTISGWVNASGNTENALTGIIMCDAGTTYSGLNIDLNGTGVGYTWANEGNTYNWIPATDATPPLPTLPASDWAYVALVVHPDQAWIYICAANNPAGFAGATNFFAHVNQAFDGPTLFGSDGGSASYSFGGKIDEVAIWDRALGVGELYTQYGAAVGGVGPKIFGDLQGPTGDVAAGDPIVLSVDAGGTPPLTFTWYEKGSAIATTTNNTLVIGTSTVSDTGNFYVTVSNSTSLVQSSPVSVTVVTPSQPTIVQLVGYQSRTLYPTGTLNIAVSATGGGLKYQWYKNALPIASATSSAFTIPHVVATNAGSYSFSITNVVGSVTSGPPVVIAIASVATNTYEASVLASVPEAWWRLDEALGSTNMFDGMGHHDGVYTNANGSGPLPTLGATGALINDPNTAASFSSTGQGIGLVPFSPALNTAQFSAEAWVNTTVSDGQAPVSSSYGIGGWWMQSVTGWWLGNSSGGTFGNNANVNTNAAILPGYWSHIVITYDSSRNIGGDYFPYQLWVNGQTDGYVWGGPALNSGGPFIIGARGASSPTVTTLASLFFDGKVDEVAYYQRLLTSTEIQAHLAARGVVTIPVTFTTPLLSQTVTTGKSISFSTSVLGTTPISLQWYKDGKSIQDATNSTYAIASTALGDAGNYTLWGTNIIGTTNISASLVVISPVGYANVTNNLVLHLTFDTDTTDSSGRGNNGTPSSTTPPVFVPGIIGPQALEYTTTTLGGTSAGPVTASSYVSLGTAGSGPPADLRFGASTSFSVSLWVKQAAGSIPGDLPYIGTATNSDYNPGWVLAPGYQNGGWEWNLNDGSSHNVNAGGTVPLINDGNWHNFVLTVDRTAAIANTYLDGVLVAGTTIASIGNIDIGNQAPIVIGQDPTFVYPEPGSATLDDIGIWRQALTALEVTQIASAGSTAGRSFNTLAPTTTGPTMTATRSGNNITISWTPAGGTLLGSPALSGAGVNWQPLGTANPAIIPITGAAQFFRVQAQ